MELLFVLRKVFLKYCEKWKGAGAEILKKEGQGTAKVVAFCKSKIVMYAALQIVMYAAGFTFFSLNPALSQESEGTKDSCGPLFLQWENLEQKSVHQHKFSLFLPDINLSLSEHCTSVQSLLL